jgi:alkanesulfonate monooxygenase SsuD/methylene tetrahydromethanopterin reductase-like flavin-dependent oxidoreductase (luciferase family)
MPNPVPPVMIGGDGEKYLLRAVAEHGDWWLTYSRGTDVIQHKMDVLQQHCNDVGRDYTTIRKVYPMTVYLAESRAAAERQAGSKTESDSPPFVGEPAALVERIQEMNALGFDHFALSFAGWSDTTDMRLFIDKVLPAFR